MVNTQPFSIVTFYGDKHCVGKVLRFLVIGIIQTYTCETIRIMYYIGDGHLDDLL